MVDPSALIRYAPIVDDWDAFGEAMRRPLPLCIHTNTTRISHTALSDLLAAEGIVARPLDWRPGAFRLDAAPKTGNQWWFCAGLAHAQEEVSQVPVTLLDVQPGHRVLDLCAAPGGKTVQIAQALDNRGTIVANDLSFDRIRALQGNLDRLGIVNVTTTRHDGCSWPRDAGGFDRVLVDAPCSSEGTWRRNRRLAERPEPPQYARFASRQRALLDKAVQLAKPGGRVVYSTCTFAPEENELVVESVLRAHEGAVELLPVRVPGLVTAPGVTRWEGRALEPALERCIRLWPHHNDTGGFFIAVLTKASRELDTQEIRSGTLVDESDGDWCAALSRRFCLPDNHWDAYRIHRQTRRGLHLVARDHCPPALPAGEASGLFFHRTNTRPAKLTTAGALMFGRLGGCNRIELDPIERGAYLARQDFDIERARASAAEPGFVIMTYLGHGLGVARLHPGGRLESLFPQRWSGCGG